MLTWWSWSTSACTPQENLIFATGSGLGLFHNHADYETLARLFLLHPQVVCWFCWLNHTFCWLNHSLSKRIHLKLLSNHSLSNRIHLKILRRLSVLLGLVLSLKASDLISLILENFVHEIFGTKSVPQTPYQRNSVKIVMLLQLLLTTIFASLCRDILIKIWKYYRVRFQKLLLSTQSEICESSSSYRFLWFKWSNELILWGVQVIMAGEGHRFSDMVSGEVRKYGKCNIWYLTCEILKSRSNRGMLGTWFQGPERVSIGHIYRSQNDAGGDRMNYKWDSIDSWHELCFPHNKWGYLTEMTCNDLDIDRDQDANWNGLEIDDWYQYFRE